MKNEKTSKKIATIAGRVLNNMEQFSKMTPYTAVTLAGLKICTISELKALCASALTQTADKQKKVKG